MKKDFHVFGFTIPTKKFFITLAIAAAVFCLLIGLDLMGVDISWYGVIIGTGFLLAVVIASDLTKERGLPHDMPYDLIWLVFPLAIIGARIAYVINSPSEFDGFWEMVDLRSGGLSIFGGIIGGTLGVVIFCLIKKINIIKTFDIAAPVLILGQSIGRWGNFVNQEVYGLEITNTAWQWFPFGVNIDGVWHLATFFYESIINLAGFFVLVLILRRSQRVGIVASTYFIWYGVVRACLELLREPQYILYIPGTAIPFSFVTSLIWVVIGVTGLIIVANKKETYKP